MRRASLILTILLLITAVWAAIPDQVHVQGRLFDRYTGEALNGTFDFTVQPVKVSTSFIPMTEYIVSGVEVTNGGFSFEFGDENLKAADFTGGILGFYLRVNSTGMAVYPSFQRISCSPSSFITYSILKGGSVEASGTGTVVTAVNPFNSGKTGILAPLSYIVRGGTPDYYGAKGTYNSSIYGKLGSYDGSKYAGIYANSRGQGENNIGFYGFSKEGSGITTRGEVALKAWNTGGGPALEVGPGRIRIPWSMSAPTWGPFYSHQIDMAPATGTGPVTYGGASGVVKFSTYIIPGTSTTMTKDRCTIVNNNVKANSLIFLTPRPGHTAGFTTNTSVEAFIASKSDRSFEIALRNSLPLNYCAEVSFLIINQFATED